MAEAAAKRLKDKTDEKEESIQKLRLALNEANKKADEQEKANQDILCMSEQQE